MTVDELFGLLSVKGYPNLAKKRAFSLCIGVEITNVVDKGFICREDDTNVVLDIQLPSSNCSPKDTPIFCNEDFPPLSRVFANFPLIQFSSSPLEDPMSPQSLGSAVGILPLKTFSNDLEGHDTITISSIRRLNVSM